MKKLDIKMIQYLSGRCLSIANKVADETGAKWFLIYGTLLGAVRHQGPIPWDADIDVMVPWSDYNDYCEALQNEIGNPFHLYRPNHDNHYGFLFARFGYEKLPQKFVHVDLFPLIGAPKELAGQRRFVRMLRLLAMVYYVKENPIAYPESLLKKMAMPILKILFLPLSAKKVYDTAQEYYGKYDPVETGFCMNACGHDNLIEVLPVGLLDQTVKLQYGEQYYRAPANFDWILTHFYGDYLTYPPLDAQKKGLETAILVSDDFDIGDLS